LPEKHKVQLAGENVQLHRNIQWNRKQTENNDESKQEA